MITVLTVVANVVANVWVFAWWIVVAYRGAHKFGLNLPKWADLVAHVARTLHAELRPFYLPATVFVIARSLPHQHSPWDLIGDAFVIVCYWVCTLDDDDRWKRRRKRVADRIKATVAGLVADKATELRVRVDRLINLLDGDGKSIPHTRADAVQAAVARDARRYTLGQILIDAGHLGGTA